MPRSFVFVLVQIALSFAGGGSQRKTPEIAPATEQVVPVSKPATRMVTEYVDFIRRANAVGTVNIIPRVTGLLVQMPLKEGSDVKKKDVLFEIDPRPYQAQFDAAKVKLALSKASNFSITLEMAQLIAVPVTML